jgi:hypothetical protein
MMVRSGWQRRWEVAGVCVIDVLNKRMQLNREPVCKNIDASSLLDDVSLIEKVQDDRRPTSVHPHVPGPCSDTLHGNANDSIWMWHGRMRHPRSI